MPDIAAFLKSLPTAASSPYALVAYLATIGAWLMVALRVKRHRLLLAHLQKLPMKDRLNAVRAEMGVVEITRGLTPEQYLRSRVHGLLLIAYLATAAAIVVVFVVAFVDRGRLTGVVQ